MLAMETLLDTLRCGWVSTLVADNEEEEKNKDDKTWHQHVFAALKKWSEKANDGEKLVRHILVKVMAAPEDSSSFGFLRSIGDFLVRHRSVVIAFMAQRIDSQGQRRKDDDLFDRLRPELILKVMPDEMFCDDTEKIIWNLIYDRATCDVEFDPVRRLAAELLGRFPSCSSKMSTLISRDLSDGIRAVRVQLYAFCNACIIGEKRMMVKRDVVVSMYVVMCDVINTHSHTHTHTHTRYDSVLEILKLALCKHDDEYRKLQRGCIDTLACCVRIHFLYHTNEKHERTMKIEEISEVEEEDDDDNEISLLNHSLQLLLKSDEYNTPFRICVANAILTIQKMLLDSSKKKELERLARSCVVDIPRDIAEQNASLFGALLRLNFFACYHSKSAARMNATRLLIVSTISIQASSAPQVRLEGLKLLGVLLSSLESMPSDLPDGLLGKMTATLRSLANMDPDRTCRKLAENLVGLLRC